MVYAIINDRGAQYRVEAGQELDVALLEADAGTEVTFNDVLMVGGEEGIRIGTPVVGGASVRAEVVGVAHGPKVVVFKYKRKTRYRRRTGHRQDYTRVAIREIVA